MNTEKRPTALGAACRKARGFLLRCFREKQPGTISFPTLFNKEDRSLQAQGPTGSQTQPPRGEHQEQSSHKEPRSSKRQGRGLGKPRQPGDGVRGEPAFFPQPSPGGSKHKGDSEAKQIRRSQPNARLAVQINRGAKTLLEGAECGLVES